MRLRLTTAFAGLAVAFAAGGAAADCAALKDADIGAEGKVTSATEVAAAEGMPAYCEVEAKVSHGPGSEITVMTRLPADWNGKLYSAGGSGYAGNIKIDPVAGPLARGYAVVGTDMGHVSDDSLEMGWIIEEVGKLDTVSLEDFGHRASHAAAVVGKALVEAQYGRAPDYAYWEGCSTGGRQGLVEAQMYPDDFDGIIAGAPVYSRILYSQLIQRAQFFRNTEGALISKEQVPLIAGAVLGACDAADGVEDGYVNNPLACSWDPGEIACAEGQDAAAGQCLTPPQVEAVRKVYDGYTNPDGLKVSDPSMRGGEGDWAVRFIGIPNVFPRGMNLRLGSGPTAHLFKMDPEWEPLSFDPDTEMDDLMEAEFTKYMIADDPDIADYVQGGGKLLLWHGFNDSGPSPLETVRYYKEVEEVVGPQVDGPVTDSVRMFLAPGVGHCRGGGGPDRFDMLTALEAWVEKGEAPERILATKAESEMQRPLCPYPTIASYKGEGDVNDAASFGCKPMEPAL